MALSVLRGIQSLDGRDQRKGPVLGFASSGSVAIGVLHELGDHQYRSHTDVLSERTVQLLKQMLEIISSSAPRSISCSHEIRPICVFTDGAAEGQDRRDVTIGSLTIYTAHTPPLSEMWRSPVPRRLIYVWQSAGNVQVDLTSRISPSPLVRAGNLERFRHRRAILFLDNVSARQALLKKISAAAASRSIYV